MNNTVLIVLLIAHVLGDFYLQTEQLSDDKGDSYPHVLLHCTIYASTVILFLIFKLELSLLWLALAYIITHLAIDTIKFWLRKKNTSCLYVVDQVAHTLTLLVLSHQFSSLTVYPKIENFKLLEGTTFMHVLSILLFFLIILNPVNITHKNVFSHINPMAKVVGEKEKAKTGALIGSLERILIALLLLVGQYTAIGLVITGKSIARYKKIQDEQAFAEYYLIGTFFSILAVLIPFLIIF